MALRPYYCRTGAAGVSRDLPARATGAGPVPGSVRDPYRRGLDLGRPAPRTTEGAAWENRPPHVQLSAISLPPVVLGPAVAVQRTAAAWSANQRTSATTVAASAGVGSSSYAWWWQLFDSRHQAVEARYATSG